MKKLAFRSIVAIVIVCGTAVTADILIAIVSGEQVTERTWQSPNGSYTEGRIEIGKVVPLVYGAIPYRTLRGTFTTANGDTVTSVLENGYGRLSFGTSDGRGIWELEDRWVVSPDGETETALTEAEIVQWKAYASQWFKSAKTGRHEQKSFYKHGLFS